MHQTHLQQSSGGCSGGSRLSSSDNSSSSSSVGGGGGGGGVGRAVQLAVSEEQRVLSGYEEAVREHRVQLIRDRWLADRPVLPAKPRKGRLSKPLRPAEPGFGFERVDGATTPEAGFHHPTQTTQPHSQPPPFPSTATAGGDNNTTPHVSEPKAKRRLSKLADPRTQLPTPDTSTATRQPTTHTEPHPVPDSTHGVSPQHQPPSTAPAAAEDLDGLEDNVDASPLACPHAQRRGKIHALVDDSSGDAVSPALLPSSSPAAAAAAALDQPADMDLDLDLVPACAVGSQPVSAGGGEWSPPVTTQRSRRGLKRQSNQLEVAAPTQGGSCGEVTPTQGGSRGGEGVCEQGAEVGPVDVAGASSVAPPASGAAVQVQGDAAVPGSALAPGAAALSPAPASRIPQPKTRKLSVLAAAVPAAAAAVPAAAAATVPAAPTVSAAAETAAAAAAAAATEPVTPAVLPGWDACMGTPMESGCAASEEEEAGGVGPPGVESELESAHVTAETHPCRPASAAAPRATSPPHAPAQGRTAPPHPQQPRRGQLSHACATCIDPIGIRPKLFASTTAPQDWRTGCSDTASCPARTPRWPAPRPSRAPSTSAPLRTRWSAARGESSAAACGDLSERHCLARLDGALQPACMALAALSQQCGLEIAHGYTSPNAVAAAAAVATTAVGAARATASASDAVFPSAGADAAHVTGTHAEAAAAAAAKTESWDAPHTLSRNQATGCRADAHTPTPPLHILNDILLCTGAAASTAAGPVTALSRLSALSAICRSEHVRQQGMVEEEGEVVRSAAAAGARLSSRRRPARFHHHLQETAPELLLHAGLMEALLLRSAVV
ncbi:MAG: hypothetical protein WDW36_007804 [Sanguina aurantia]